MEIAKLKNNLFMLDNTNGIINNMKNEVLKNLENISSNDLAELSELIKNNTNVEEYFLSNYQSLMDEWKKEYPMFDVPSGIVSISINGETKYITMGQNHYDENTLFDIASMSKLYTEFILFEFLHEYNLSLETKICEIVEFYENIKDLTLMNLINFNNTYKTTIDIRNCSNKEEAIKALRTAYIVPEKQGYYLYTDLPIMILTDIMESYTKMSYKKLFQKYIINKYNLADTHLEIDTTERYVTINKNMTNDPKANIMGGYYGHCGVKTTSKDFIKFLNTVFDNEYKELFTKPSSALNENGEPTLKKSVIGNLNLSRNDDDSLASRYLPKTGFAIQGSVRCHAETAIFKIDHKEYTVSISIFQDLYTQLDNIIKYEDETGQKISKEYSTDGYNTLIMTDIRNIIPYKGGVFKKITNLVGKCRAILLYQFIKKEIKNNYSE